MCFPSSSSVLLISYPVFQVLAGVTLSDPPTLLVMLRHLGGAFIVAVTFRVTELVALRLS